MNSIAKKNGTARRVSLALAALLFVFGTAAGCSDRQEDTQQGTEQGTGTPSAGGGTGTGDATKEPAAGGTAGGTEAPKAEQPVQLSPITYTDVDKQSITQTAKVAGVSEIYLPQQGAAGEKIDQVQSAEKLLTVKFLKMSVTMSPSEIKPAGTVEKTQDVKLKLGAAQWITVGGQQALYVKVGNTFVSISSSLSTKETEAIAETLSVLK